MRPAASATSVVQLIPDPMATPVASRFSLGRGIHSASSSA